MHAVAENGASWEGRIELNYARDRGRSYLAHCRHHGPLRVQRPFHPEGPEVCHTYLLHPPGGVVCSDRLQIHVRAAAGSHVLLTTPGAGKFYRSTGRHQARIIQHLTVERGATVEWLPQENIFYDGARCEVLTHVDLSRGGRFLGWEIDCLGRPASDERFTSGSVRLRFELWHGDEPLWLERNCFTGGAAILDAAWGLQGLPVTATLVCAPAPPELAPELTGALRGRIEPRNRTSFAVTVLEEVLICRVLCRQSHEARRLLEEAWRVLRPALCGRDAVPPRIWNT